MLTANKLHSDTNNTEGSGERGTKRMKEREKGNLMVGELWGCGALGKEQIQLDLLH